MYVNFEFAALLPSPYSRVKKCAKFKTNINLVSVDSFLYYLSSKSIGFYYCGVNCTFMKVPFERKNTNGALIWGHDVSMEMLLILTR